VTIIGIGIDATEIPRIAEAIERYGERFLQRVFTEGEIAYCRRKRDFASSFAARFAAKEAAMKALGTGHSQGVFWRGIEVVRRQGPPSLQMLGSHGGQDASAEPLLTELAADPHRLGVPFGVRHQHVFDVVWIRQQQRRAADTKPDHLAVRGGDPGLRVGAGRGRPGTESARRRNAAAPPSRPC